MLAEDDIGLRESLEKPIVNHRLRALRRLLRRLKDGHQRPLPCIARLRKQFGRTDQPGHMHVVTTGVHHRHALPSAVRRRDLTGIGKAGSFLNRQRIHVGAEHHCRSLAIAQQTDNAGLANPGSHFIADSPQVLRTRSPFWQAS